MAHQAVEYFEVRTRKDISSSYRQLSGKSAGEVLDKALETYLNTWKYAPDEIEVTKKNTAFSYMY